MSTRARLVLASVVLAVVLTALPSSVRAEAPDPYEKARAVARTSVWKDLNSGVAGSATVAITDGGRVVYAEGFGMADREKSLPVAPDTLFNIGSISKVFTAVAIMQLVDEGKVKLDEPVVTYLPDFKMADPRYRDITVRMLLNHASGLPGTTGQNDFGFRYNKDVFQQILGNLANSHLKHPPGAHAPYTNDGFSLAEIVVERVSGKKFLDFLAERVFTPLAMPNTGAGVGDEPGKPVAAYYSPETGKREPLEVLSLLGAGGLASTAVDLCRFQDSFSGHGPQVLSPSGLAEMRKEQPSGFRGKLKHSDLAFGLGWDMVDLPTYRARGIQVLGKSGGTGRYTSMMFTVPAQGISVAVIEAAESGHSMKIALDMLDAVLAEKGLLAQKPSEVEKPLAHQAIPRTYARYAGYYVPLRKISFDFKKNLVTSKSMQFGAPEQTSTLFFNNGYFHDAAGNKYYFQTVDGQDYFLMYQQALDVDMMAGQRLQKLDQPKSLRIKMDGVQWLARNSKWYDGIQGTEGHVMKSRTFAELPGYVEFGNITKVVSPDFAGMPVDNIRDLSELALIDRDGATWARLSEALYSPASGAAPLKAGASILALGPEGFSEWRKAASGLILTFEKPAESRVIVFSPDGEPAYDSAVDNGPVYVEKGSFVEFAGAPGAELKIQAR